MKKFLIRSILCVILLGITGCGERGTAPMGNDSVDMGETAENPVFEAIVLEAEESSMLVEPLEGTAERDSADQIRISISGETEEKTAESLSDIEVGDTVRIEYSGEIMETYPGQINDVYGITLVKKAKNADSDSACENIIGILAYVKEVHQDGTILICSECEDFPGTFAVAVPEEVSKNTELSEGDFILIQMKEEKGGQEKDSSPEYVAKGILVTEETEEEEKEAVSLTSAPAFFLSDVLSSLLNSFEVQSGNYAWTYEMNNEMATVVACGAHPLDMAALEHQEKLKLPSYNGMDTVLYLFSCEVMPDMLTIREWSAEDMGNLEAEEKEITTFYYPVSFVELKPGCIYEFTAVWKEENLEVNGFYGDAGYVVVTE